MWLIITKISKDWRSKTRLIEPEIVLKFVKMAGSSCIQSSNTVQILFSKGSRLWLQTLSVFWLHSSLCIRSSTKIPIDLVCSVTLFRSDKGAYCHAKDTSFCIRPVRKIRVSSFSLSCPSDLNISIGHVHLSLSCEIEAYQQKRLPCAAERAEILKRLHEIPGCSYYTAQNLLSLFQSLRAQAKRKQNIPQEPAQSKIRAVTPIYTSRDICMWLLESRSHHSHKNFLSKSVPISQCGIPCKIGGPLERSSISNTRNRCDLVDEIGSRPERRADMDWASPNRAPRLGASYYPYMPWKERINDSHSTSMDLSFPAQHSPRLQNHPFRASGLNKSTLTLQMRIFTSKKLWTLSLR